LGVGLAASSKPDADWIQQGRLLGDWDTLSGLFGMHKGK